MARIVEYQTNLPTKSFGIGRMRVDLIERMQALSKVRGVSVTELVNNFVENGCNLLEAVEKKKVRERTEQEDLREHVKRMNEEREKGGVV